MGRSLPHTGQFAFALASLLVLGQWHSVTAEETPAASPLRSDKPAVRTVDFDRDVQPILASKCIHCHGPGTAEAGLRLDGRGSAITELESGTHAIVPGSPETSELLRRVTAEEFEIMPPEGEPLTAAQVETLRTWIAQGASWPEHWAYRPLELPALPEWESSAEGFEPTNWIRTPVDRFVLHQLLEHGLEPAPAADRRTLIRRLSFDLLGLPPTPEEVEAFVHDPAPDAYEQLVERLLASPQYGERWARHWMDVVHYADTHGFEHDLPREIWPYRDYLVQAFNSDEPYPLFIRKQLAGDVLFPGDPQALAATGFLATGPWDKSAQQSGNANSIDRIIAQHQDRDDIVSTVMSTFVSTTVHCARCHDHKFDPVSQRDYYSLQAVFAGIDKAHRMYDPDPVIARQRLTLQNRIAEIRQRKANQDPSLLSEELQAEIATWETRFQEQQPKWQVLIPTEYRSAHGSTLTLEEDGSVFASGERPEKEITTFVIQTDLPKLTALKLEVLTDDRLPLHGPGRQDNGNLHLNELLVSVAPLNDPTATRPLKLVRPLADFNQQGWEIDKALDNNPRTAWGIFPQIGHPHEAIFELAEPLENAQPVLLTIELQQIHGQGHLIGRARLSASSQPTPLAHDLAPLPTEITQILDTASQARTPEQKLQLAAWYLVEQAERQVNALPPQQRLYCATNQFQGEGGFQPATAPREIHLLKRGDITQPGELVPPGTLQFIPGLSGEWQLPNPEQEGTRRAALADWLASPRNVLTWRSMANRIWQYHFGQGLVDTPGDFGRMGSAPSHPELLDWLAVTLRDNGGSLKDLHRIILLSAAYRQSTRFNSQAAALDGGNKLLWRMNRQRLDGESVRDALLKISGQLDPQFGGPPVKLFNETKSINERVEAEYQTFDVDDPANRRRSLYRFVFRTFPDPLLAALDCPDGTQLTPVRNTSLTSLQALATLNDKFVIRQSEHIAARVSSSTSDPRQQVIEAYRLILLRAPDPEELNLVTTYATQHGLANTCRFLVNTNEFFFLE